MLLLVTVANSKNTNEEIKTNFIFATYKINNCNIYSIHITINIENLILFTYIH